MNDSNNLALAVIYGVVGAIVGVAIEGFAGNLLREVFQSAIDANPNSSAVLIHNLGILLLDLAPLAGLISGGIVGYLGWSPSKS